LVRSLSGAINPYFVAKRLAETPPDSSALSTPELREPFLDDGRDSLTTAAARTITVPAYANAQTGVALDVERRGTPTITTRLPRDSRRVIDIP
jgi:hypothetical protein